MSLFSPTLLRRALRFACTGVGVTALHALIALLFLRFLLPLPALANGTAFSLATALSYWVNTRWSFSSPLRGSTLLRFLLVSAVGLLVAMSVARLAELNGLANWQGIALVALSVPPLSFLLHNFWTYR